MKLRNHCITCLFGDLLQGSYSRNCLLVSYLTPFQGGKIHIADFLALAAVCSEQHYPILKV